MASDPVLETTGLHKNFGDIHAVDGVDLAIKSGEIYGLIGPNGSGKTTLIRLCLGLLIPTDGAVRLLGKPIPNKAVLSQVGYMTQASVSLLYGAEVFITSDAPFKRLQDKLEVIVLDDFIDEV